MTKNPFDDFLSRSVSFELVPEEERQGGGDGKTLDGYAAIFNQPTRIDSWEGRFDETIAPGAFTKTLRERIPLMQFNHGRDSRFGTLPIGVYDEVKEDGKGLHVRGRLFDHAEPIRQAIQGGAVTGMSFKFQPTRETWTDNAGKEIRDKNELMRLLWGDTQEAKDRGPLKRTIKELRMMECGPVVTPAYAGTSVGVRSADNMSDGDREWVVDHLTRAKDSELRGEPGPELLAAWSDVECEEYDSALRALDVDDESRAASAAKAKKAPYGDVAYADPGYQADKKKRYPVDTKEHVVAAWDYINKASNASKYTAEQLAKVKSAIKAAAKKFGVTISSEKSDEGFTAETTSVAPAEGADAGEREENPDDAAQAGTSTGLTGSARERRLRLLELVR